MLTPTNVEHVRAYAPYIKEVCGSDFDPFDMAAVGLRETACGWGSNYSPHGSPFGRGDGGHGYGIYQIDDRWHADLIAEIEHIRAVHGDELALARMHEVALQILVQGRDHLASPERTHPLTGDALRSATFAAYNAGAGRVAEAAKEGANWDELTTGGDYGQWVCDRSAQLRQAAPELFP